MRRVRAPVVRQQLLHSAHAAVGPLDAAACSRCSRGLIVDLPTTRRSVMWPIMSGVRHEGGFQLMAQILPSVEMTCVIIIKPARLVQCTCALQCAGHTNMQTRSTLVCVQ